MPVQGASLPPKRGARMNTLGLLAPAARLSKAFTPLYLETFH
jgi:hypothetical protein